MKAGKTMTGKEILYSILMNNNVVYSIENNLEPLLNLIPELKDTIGFDHKHPHHHLDVWNHTLCALSHAPSNFDLRLVLLLHDIGKALDHDMEGTHVEIGVDVLKKYKENHFTDINIFDLDGRLINTTQPKLFNGFKLYICRW